MWIADDGSEHKTEKEGRAADERHIWTERINVYVDARVTSERGKSMARNVLNAFIDVQFEVGNLGVEFPAVKDKGNAANGDS